MHSPLYLVPVAVAALVVLHIGLDGGEGLGQQAAVQATEAQEQVPAVTGEQYK